MTIKSSSQKGKLIGYVDVRGPDNIIDTIVFLPGGPGLGHEYLPGAFHSLERDFRLIYYTPGYSSGFKNISLRKLSDELRQLVEVHATKRIGFVAHSGGALILLDYFARFGASPTVFISAVADMNWLEIYRNKNTSVRTTQTHELEDPQKMTDSVEALRARMLKYLNQYFPPAGRERGRLILNKINYYPQVSSAIEYELNSGLTLKSFFECSKAPFLVIGGLNDQVIYPEYFNDLCKNRKNQTKTIFIENAGHFGFIDQPKKYSEQIEIFFKTNQDQQDGKSPQLSPICKFTDQNFRTGPNQK